MVTTPPTGLSARQPVFAGALVTLRAAMAEVGAARESLHGGTGLGAVARLDVATEELRVAEEELGQRLSQLDHEDRDGTFTRLVSVLPVAVVTTRSDGAIVTSNAAAAQLLHLPPATLATKPIFAYVDPEGRSEARGLLQAAVADGSIREGSIRLRVRDGSVIGCRAWVIAETSPTSDADTDTDTDVRWVLTPEGGAGDDEAARAAVVELCRLGITDGDLHAVLGRIARLAAAGVTTAAAASVVLGDPAAPEILASSDAAAQSADGVQLEAGAGPAFDAYRSRRPSFTDDLSADRRWPELGSGQARGGSGTACLAIPLLADPATSIGVLTLYGSAGGPAALDLSSAESLQQARPFAVTAESLVRDGKLVAEIVRARDQLREALTSRAVIDQAKGIVMATRRCSAEEAFRYLSRISNDTNRKVRDVAVAIVAGATMPSVTPRS